MVEEGNPNTLDRHDLINFEKRRRQAYVIQEALLYQSYPFNFSPEGKIQTYIGMLEKKIEGEESIYQLSIACEPREPKKKRISAVDIDDKNETETN